MMLSTKPNAIHVEGVEGSGESGLGATLPMSRRRALRVGLATAVLLVVAGCASSGRSDKALDKSFRNLRDTLNGLAADEQEQAQLASIARRIENRGRELLEEHDEFRARFDALSRRSDIIPAELVRLATDFGERRAFQRNEMLKLQDELRGELTAAEWSEAARALQQKQEAFRTTPSFGSGA